MYSMDKIIISKNKKNKEQMTAGLFYSTRRKNELSFKVKKYPLNKSLFIYYKKQRNKFNSIVRLTKLKFYKN